MARVHRFVPGWVRWTFEAPLNVTDKSLTAWLLCAAAVSSLWQFSVPLGIIGLATAEGIAIVTLGDLLKSSRMPRRRLGRRCATAALVAIALNVGVERCPHATYISVGPVSVPVSDRACNNPRHPTGMLNVVTGLRSPWGP
jgi:hypothetical protein